VPKFEPLWFCALRPQFANLRESLRGQYYFVKYAIINNNNIIIYNNAALYIICISTIKKKLFINEGKFIILYTLTVDGELREFLIRNKCTYIIIIIIYIIIIVRFLPERDIRVLIFIN